MLHFKSTIVYMIIQISQRITPQPPSNNIELHLKKRSSSK